MEWDYLQFALRFENALKTSGKQKRQVAKAIATDAAVLSGWKRDRSRPSLEQILNASQFLGVGPAWLAFGVGPQGGLDSDAEHDLCLLKALQPAEQECLRTLMGLMICRDLPDSPDKREFLKILRSGKCEHAGATAPAVPQFDSQATAKSPAPVVPVPDACP
jgi:transcriptional regulator with XRE-family HTH domain